MKICVLLDNGHGADTKGKQSPDGRLREYAWAREVVALIAKKLAAENILHEIITPEIIDVSLQERVRRINAMCAKNGSKNYFLISVHVNAAGADGKWHDASGFSTYVSKNASANSKRMAALLTDEFIGAKITGNRHVPACKYWTWDWTKSDIYILHNSNCPAVLTECGFQDNKKDVEYLLSDAGKQEVADLHVAAIKKYIGK